jgi:hypothetical protein
MRYTTPQITAIHHATEAIQSIGLPPDQKTLDDHLDNPVTFPNCTLAAYESDE